MFRIPMMGLEVIFYGYIGTEGNERVAKRQQVNQRQEAELKKS